MKKFLVFAAFVSNFAMAVAEWTDGNAMTWTLLDVKTSVNRGSDRCRALGYGLPLRHDIYEALDYGMANETLNPAFGAAMKSVDWMWTREVFQVVTPSYFIVSKQGDSVPVHADERHWVVCVKPASN